MSAVKQAYELTEKLIELTNQSITIEDRDQRIEQITELLSKRDDLLSDIKPPFSEEENQLGKQMAIWNEQILSKFIELKKQIQMDLTQLKKRRQQVINT